MTESKKRLGRGLDALIPIPSKEEAVVVKEEEAIDKLAEAVEEAKKNPRISTWSPKASAVLRYLRKTRTEFSISKEAGILLEEAVRAKYPKIWAQISEA